MCHMAGLPMALHCPASKMAFQLSFISLEPAGAPKAPVPAAVATKPSPFQQAGLQWMLEREGRGCHHYVNFLTTKGYSFHVLACAPFDVHTAIPKMQPGGQHAISGGVLADGTNFAKLVLHPNMFQLCN